MGDNSQKSLTETIKKLETEKLKIESEFGICSENERKLRSQVETLELEIEQIREELDRAQQKSSLTDELEKDNHQTKNKIETYKDELTKSLAQKEADLKKLKDDLQAAAENIEDLKNSLVKAGKALDDSIADKETLESEYNKKLDDFEAEMKQQKKQWDSENN